MVAFNKACTEHLNCPRVSLPFSLVLFTMWLSSLVFQDPAEVGLTFVLVCLKWKDFSSARKVILVVEQGFLHCLIAMQDHGALGAQVQGEHWPVPLCQLQRPASSQVRPLGAYGEGGTGFKLTPKLLLTKRTQRDLRKDSLYPAQLGKTLPIEAFFCRDGGSSTPRHLDTCAWTVTLVG